MSNPNHDFIAEASEEFSKAFAEHDSADAWLDDSEDTGEHDKVPPLHAPRRGVWVVGLLAFVLAVAVLVALGR